MAFPGWNSQGTLSLGRRSGGGASKNGCSMAEGKIQTQIVSLISNGASAIEKAAELLMRGEVVAFPTETVYGLGATALRTQAVRRIFIAKGRPQDNPLIVHVSDLAMAKQLTTNWTPLAQKLSRAFWPGPLSIIVNASPAIPKEVTAGLGTVALRMPNHDIALKLIALAGPIAAPSANVSGRPSPVNAMHVYEDLAGRIPLILDGGVCEYGLESTVVDARGDIPIVLRPGGVTEEMIRSVCGACDVAQGVFAPVEGYAASPGMLHTHYAPMGRATLITMHEGMAKTMRTQFDAAKSQGFSPVILCSEKTENELFDLPHIRCDEGGTMAHGLFDALRRADALGYDRIFIEGVEMDGMGTAYMNRALRAAGFDVLGEL